MTPTFLLLIKYRYFILFPIAVIEGPIITVISGFLLAQGFFNVFILFSVFIIGDLVGDILYYSLGRYGGLKILKKWGHLINMDEKKIEELSPRFKKHEVKISLFGKTQAIGSVVLFIAGLTKMNFRKFIIVNGLASLPKVIIFLLIGYYFGSAYVAIDSYMKKIGIISTLILVIGFIIYFLHIRKKNEKNTFYN